jgi:hypothetical protein
MLNKKALFTKVIMITLALLLLTVYVFIANEARKEVYFLCGNFTQGVALKDVTRQLDTATFSSYSKEFIGTGELIVFSSPVNFHYFQCNIEINNDELVVSASYQ